jgi:hypothetical protein
LFSSDSSNIADSEDRLTSPFAMDGTGTGENKEDRGGFCLIIPMPLHMPDAPVSSMPVPSAIVPAPAPEAEVEEEEDEGIPATKLPMGFDKGLVCSILARAMYPSLFLS